MKKAELSVIRYAAEDVIAASGVPTTNWSEKSYWAGSPYSVDTEEGPVYTNYISPIEGTSFYNYLNGEGSEDDSGFILNPCSYYHFGSYAGPDPSGYPMYTEWLECFDENHFYW